MATAKITPNAAGNYDLVDIATENVIGEFDLDEIQDVMAQCQENFGPGQMVLEVKAGGYRASGHVEMHAKKLAGYKPGQPVPADNKVVF